MTLETDTVVHHFLEASARQWPAKTAFIHDSLRATYEQINSMANGFALWLRDKGLRNGDRVVIVLENSIEYVVSYYGVLKAGGVAVPLNSSITTISLSAQLKETEPAVIVTDSKYEKSLLTITSEAINPLTLVIIKPSCADESSQSNIVAWEDVLHARTTTNPGLHVSESALASIIYTSGSTGAPKGVMLSHKNIATNTRAIVNYLDLDEQDILMVVLPFYYVMGKSLLNTHFAVGGTVIINNKIAFPAAVIEQMVTERVTGFSGVPSTYAYLLHRSPLKESRDNLGSLRYCSQAGGHMSSILKEQLLQILPAHTQLFIMYGATEASARLTYVEPEKLRSKLDSIGIPIPGVVIKVINEEGHELPSGEQGELVADGPNIMMGYWKNVEQTSRVLDDNGYHTGDIGYQDEDGYYYLTGRKDNLMKVGGNRINPQEVEDALMATKLLVEVAVVGVDDHFLGKRIAAVAVPICRHTREIDILAKCRPLLPRNNIPSEIVLVTSLNKNSNGKIDRTRCLELFNGNQNQ